jgi:hypothetical protein
MGAALADLAVAGRVLAVPAGRAEPALTPGERQPLADERGLRAELLPGDSAPLRAGRKMVAGDEVALAPVMMDALVAAMRVLKLVVDRVCTPERDQEPSVL